jgi:acyl-CoA thioesterase-2
MNAKVYYASLDHALWFHRKFKIDEWLLYAIESPSASNARGFSRGSIFDQNGLMVASVTQEGLMRKYK